MNIMRAIEGKPCLWIVIAASVAALTGCARFQHQTTEAEPHALVSIVDNSEFPEFPQVKRIDGLPVSAGKHYRLKPGQHEYATRAIQYSVESYRPATVGSGGASDSSSLYIPSSGAPQAYGGSTFGSSMQPVTIHAEDRQVVWSTNTFSVEPGHYYQLDANGISKMH